MQCRAGSIEPPLAASDCIHLLTREGDRSAMGIHDDYHLPDDHKLAVHMLGNAVPPPMTREVITALRKAA